MNSLAIAFALLGLLFAVLAAGEWGDASDEPDRPEPPRRSVVGGVLVLLLCALATAMIWVGFFTEWTFGR